jgi:hypothetical protein
MIDTRVQFQTYLLKYRTICYIICSECAESEDEFAKMSVCVVNGLKLSQTSEYLLV